MIRVGLVGFGLGGRVFHAPLISSVEGLELAAIVERGSDKAAGRYPAIAIHRSLPAMLEEKSLSLIVISTPSGTHVELARQALEAGRNVVVDKPLALSSAQVAELTALASSRSLLLAPFHNRRWDSDFQTIQKLLHEGSLGRLVHFHSCFDRWSPGSARRPWKNDPGEGGLLHDLGTHLADQALVLFGKPEAVSADVVRERDGEGANDAFNLRLRYPGLSVALSANSLSAPGRPRFLLRGTHGNYWKWGLDPQEAALTHVARIPPGPWAQEPTSSWGTLNVDVDGAMVTRPVAPVISDYRSFYAALRDALLLKSPAPVPPIAAWRTARLLEWSAESAQDRQEIPCDWSEEPA
jgi:predicted dehydrogenase